MSQKALLLAVTLVAVCLGMPSVSHAKGVPFLYNTGEQCFEAGPLPGAFAKDPELAGFQAAYLCDIQGVMWSYFSISGCKAVACQGETYADDAQLVAAIKAVYPESAMQVGLWGRYGWMLLAALAALGGLFWLKDLISGAGDEDEEEAKPSAPAP